jgi:hypothetical protein
LGTEDEKTRLMKLPTTPRTYYPAAAREHFLPGALKPRRNLPNLSILCSKTLKLFPKLNGIMPRHIDKAIPRRGECVLEVPWNHLGGWIDGVF